MQALSTFFAVLVVISMALVPILTLIWIIRMVLKKPAKKVGVSVLASVGCFVLSFILFAVITSKPATASESSVQIHSKESTESVKVTEAEKRVESSINSESDYRGQCRSVNYKELCRYPEKYQGEKVTVKVKVQQILDAGLFSTDKAWRALTDNGGYGWYADDEYYIIDKRSSDAVKILEDDIVIVYGEFTGLEKITRALTGNTDELPRIEVKYADLVDDIPEKTYEEVLEEYSQKIRNATPRLIAEYQEEAKNNQSGITGLAELSNKKIEELANIQSEGTEEMAKIYMYNGTGSYNEYSEWSEKLFDVYMEEAEKITDAYMASAR